MTGRLNENAPDIIPYWIDHSLGEGLNEIERKQPLFFKITGNTMKIALLNTPYLFTYGRIKSGHNCSFPMGLGYIASYVRSFGHRVQLFDPEAHRVPLSKMWDQIRDFSPDLIGVTSVTANFQLAKQLVVEGKKIGRYVIMGGPHVSALPKNSLQSIPSLDAVIVGEGEIPVLTIADNFDKHKEIDFGQVPGAAFYTDGRFRRNVRAKLIEDIDTIPYPARDLVDIDVYRLHGHFQRGKKSATILSSRGCPSKCTFCGNLVMKRRFRPRSPDNIVGELEHLANDYGIGHFHFVDDCFSYDIEGRTKL